MRDGERERERERDKEREREGEREGERERERERRERVALACWSRINYGFAPPLAEATIASSDIRLLCVRSEKETMEKKEAKVE